MIQTLKKLRFIFELLKAFHWTMVRPRKVMFFTIFQTFSVFSFQVFLFLNIGKRTRHFPTRKRWWNNEKTHTFYRAHIKPIRWILFPGIEIGIKFLPLEMKSGNEILAWKTFRQGTFWNFERAALNHGHSLPAHQQQNHDLHAVLSEHLGYNMKRNGTNNMAIVTQQSP